MKTAADRQPECSARYRNELVEQEDILELMESLFINLVEKVTPNKRVLKPFPRIAT